MKNLEQIAIDLREKIFIIINDINKDLKIKINVSYAYKHANYYAINIIQNNRIKSKATNYNVKSRITIGYIKDSINIDMNSYKYKIEEYKTDDFIYHFRKWLKKSKEYLLQYDNNIDYNKILIVNQQYFDKMIDNELDKNNINIFKKIDIETYCSNWLLQKYIHLFNASNFDLI